MIIEDFRSEKFRNLKKTNLTAAELRHMISILNNLYTEGKCLIHIGKDDFEISLIGSIDNREITIIENSILECGHDITKIKKEIAIDVESKFQRKKNQIINSITKNFENQLVELDKLKQSYADKLKDLVNFSLQLEKKEKSLELRELKLQKNNFDGRLPQNLEERLKELESFTSFAVSENEPKMALKIEQLKNKNISLRAEKVISESKQTTSVLSRILKAMEREVSFDEKQRKKLFEKYSESHTILQTDIERPGISTIKKLEENFRIYMEKARLRIKKKESELLEKEKKLNES